MCSLWRGRLAALVAVGALLAALASACGSVLDPGKPVVVAAFYPLQFVAERVAGAHARVVNLTAPGVEPHDLELTVRQVATVSGAAVGIYELGLQPSVDEAMRNDAPRHELEVGSVVQLHAPVPGQSGAGGVDPHFWQDPSKLAKVATAFTNVVSRAEPAYAAVFGRNNRALQGELTALDRAYRTGLAHCRTRDLVVAHDAFEYLGRRYHLRVHSIAGLTPDAEPSPRHLAKLADLIRHYRITTVFTERLASPQLARTLASDLGIRTAVLDPLEGLTSTDPTASYLTLMRANLDAIRRANSCS